MEGQEYLNQISASNRPVKKSGGLKKILSSKFLWIGVAGVVVFIMIAMIGSMLSNSKSDEKGLVLELRLHVDNTVSVIGDYQRFVKSSNLRSSSASLAGVLSNTRTELDEYIGTLKDAKLSDKQTAKAEEDKETLKNELFEAKINGILDRIYAHKMAYEVSLLMNEEARIYETTGNDILKEILGGSYNSLENLYDKFNDFSETK